MTCKRCATLLTAAGTCPKCAATDATAVFRRPVNLAPMTPVAAARLTPVAMVAGPLTPGPGAPARSPERRLVIEGYDILRTLGMGGVGVVYLAREKATQKLFAAKVLRPSLHKNREIVARFRREVEVAQKISHKNVAKVHSFNEALGHVFILMEYIDGVDLGQYIKTESPTFDQKLSIMRAVCAAVDAAHEVGVVHRDLKPGNIMMSKEGTPYVLDFGIASADDNVSVTRPGSFIGTPLYVSPEQAQGKSVDQRSDIYALGAIFYEMMTGRPPFIGDSAITIALKHIRETPFRPRSINPDIPTVIENVILRCLEKDASSRPQRASDIVAEIDRPIQREVEAAKAAARSMAHEQGSGDLHELSLFQYLRVITPIRRNFVFEIVNNEEFGRYHFRGAHLVHAEARNLRDEEVAYNLFYWTRGIYRVVTDAEPPPRESVMIPWIPFVEKYFERVRRSLLGAHGVVEGPVIVDLLDPKGSSVYRYCSDSRFERAVGERAAMGVEAFRRGRSHLKANDLLKISKSGEEGSMLFCYSPGLRHFFYVVLEPSADVEALYRWIKNELEQEMVEGLHDCLIEVDKKRRTGRGAAKVLVVESEEFLGNSVRIKLRSLGFDVYLVRDGNKVLEVAPQFKPDVILLDVNVRGMSGHDVCRLLAVNAELARVPIVLLVPNERAIGADDSWPPGVVKAVAKPVVLSELVELLNRYATRRSRHATIPIVREPVPSGR